MNHPLPDVVVAASRLGAALDETAAALAGADLERLLASDALLHRVLGEIPRTATLTPEERDLLRRRIDDAEAALTRCRRLGDALNDFVRVSLGAQGHGLGYDPGRPTVPVVTGRTLNERV